jgi:hypothetical protein
VEIAERRRGPAGGVAKGDGWWRLGPAWHGQEEVEPGLASGAGRAWARGGRATAGGIGRGGGGGSSRPRAAATDWTEMEAPAACL